jgi:hypothetical protein
MKNLAKAVIAVMKEVKGMEKNSRVGTGNSAYDGTKDKDVKEVFNEKLAEHGLCILPTGIEETTQIDRWIDPQYGGQKQSVFTKVKTKYLLLHESGESQEIFGYGHGVDPQDKGAGKATTYALKNLLLYTFLTPVGKIDDTDTTHSSIIAQVGNTGAAKQTPAAPILDIPRLNNRLNACNTMGELQTTYKAFTPAEQAATAATKDAMKLKLQ